ncbi:nucleoside phosphorylase domain-containing protein [Aspergillus pseudoustus]|uniref:Nucleoside phosphorylase domain-containing protein n=1 Tax=Aspergillus pseudoustus TaxID=1810923 RepID=A0ABR4IX28_9EURO
MTPSTSPPPPKTRIDFHIAIMCALPLEADAVEGLFDRRYDSDGHHHGWTRKAPGDPNAYSTGTMDAHNVVLVYMPGMGKSHGAAAAAFCRSSSPNIKLALVVGICGAAPFAPDGREIHLGDVVISSGVVQHDFARRYGEGVLVRKNAPLDNLGRPSLEIRALLAQLVGRWGRKRIRDRLREHLEVVERKLGPESGYPTENVAGWLTEEAHDPDIHIGLVASGDQVMRSEHAQDRLVREEGVIAFEMESAGIWDTFPCLVIKGVADYADVHKNKKWQNYAAATAASCAKAFLEFWE